MPTQIGRRRHAAQGEQVGPGRHRFRRCPARCQRLNPESGQTGEGLPTGQTGGFEPEPPVRIESRPGGRPGHLQGDKAARQDEPQGIQVGEEQRGQTGV